MNARSHQHEILSKVPAVTLGFWIIKILATTLGETGGDTVTMSWLGETTEHPVPYGYLIGTAIFGVLLVGSSSAQIRAQQFNPWLYWATIVASTTCGTTLADFADRSLGIGYPGGSLLLLACVLVSLFAWHRTLGHRRRQHASPARAKRPSTGSRSPSRRRSAPRSATGRRTSPRGRLGPRLFGRSAGVRRRRSLFSRSSISRRERQPRVPVLGGVHPDPAARRDGRRLARQAGRQGRARDQPAGRVGGAGAW